MDLGHGPGPLCSGVSSRGGEHGQGAVVVTSPVQVEAQGQELLGAGKCTCSLSSSPSP